MIPAARRERRASGALAGCPACLTRHPREMSWTVMRGIDDGLTHLFGDRWMEN
jgi:hypothetical protein